MKVFSGDVERIQSSYYNTTSNSNDRDENQSDRRLVLKEYNQIILMMMRRSSTFEFAINFKRVNVFHLDCIIVVHLNNSIPFIERIRACHQ